MFKLLAHVREAVLDKVSDTHGVHPTAATPGADDE
jgi:hypothetical protein